MKNLKLKVIFKYLKPYKKEFLYGGIALLVVNILSILIPLEVKNIIDQLKDDFPLVTLYQNHYCSCF